MYSLTQWKVQSVLPAQQITVKWRWIIDNTYLQSTVSGFLSLCPDKKIKCLKTLLPFVTSSYKELQTLCLVLLSPFPERAKDPSLLSPLLRRGLAAILSADSGYPLRLPLPYLRRLPCLSSALIPALLLILFILMLCTFKSQTAAREICQQLHLL